MNNRAYWSLSVLLIAWIYFFWPTLKTFDHHQPLLVNLLMMMILLGSAYGIYQRRAPIEQTAFSSSQLGLICLTVLISVWIYAGIVHLVPVQQATIILMLPAIVLLSCGPYVAQILVFPLLYLLLLIPLLDKYFPYPNLIVWLAFGMMFAFLRYQNLILRIVYIGFTFFLGWLSQINKLDWIHPIFMVLLLLLLGLFPDKKEGQLWFKGVTGKRFITQASRWLMPTSIAFCMMMTSPWLADNLRDFYLLLYPKVVLNAPQSTGPWVGPTAIKDPTWKPDFSNASASFLEQYQIPGKMMDAVDLYMAYYQSNRSINDLLNSHNTIYNKAVWKENGPSKVIDSGFGQMKVVETLLQSENENRILWTWYYVSGFVSTDLSILKLLDAVRSIAKHAQGSGILIVSTRYFDNVDAARTRLRIFLEDIQASLTLTMQPEQKPNSSSSEDQISHSSALQKASNEISKINNTNNGIVDVNTINTDLNRILEAKE